MGPERSAGVLHMIYMYVVVSETNPLTEIIVFCLSGMTSSYTIIIKLVA